MDKLYSPNQINQFKESMIEAIETKKKEMEEKKFRSVEEAKKSAIEELKDSCTDEEKIQPTIKEIIEKYSRKINNSEVNNISTLLKKANELIVEERVKRQGLHWKRKIKKEEQRMNKLNANAPYAINFPPSLWNDLSEEEKQHEKAKELKLDPKVDNDFNFQRSEGGEVRYILFVDEADQISENSFSKESTGLTFLKECMGSDDYKNNETKIDPAAYRPGRLSNPLDFNSSQLEHFEGKFINPRQPKIEEVVEKNMILAANQISRSIDTRLKEIALTAENIKNNSREDINNYTAAVESGLETPLLIGFCFLCGTYCVKKVHDVFAKKEKNKKRKLELKDEEIKKFKNKLRDPNLSDEEKRKINSQLAILTDQQESDIKERSSILDKIKKIGERIKNNNQIISGTVSNLDDKH
ncbi:23627_t:CDS:2 [Gigaspora margarita]|uniref:23627_t:CDS:1 n=1 Tax=Gigaspora margarita TaxID=4874 RepID=A0ABN7VVI0_GIGMA|nr:23627_t:CDS:2 [Gigaspora margarita]